MSEEEPLQKAYDLIKEAIDDETNNRVVDTGYVLGLQKALRIVEELLD